MKRQTMTDRNRALVAGAATIAEQSGAHAVVLAAPLAAERDYLRARLGSRHKLITAVGSRAEVEQGDGEILLLPQVRLRRRGRAKVALLEALATGLLDPGERVVIISGNAHNGMYELDTVALIEMGRGRGYFDAEAGAALALLQKAADPAVFDALLGLCIEIGQEGREGKNVGLLVTLGDDQAVLDRSHQLVLNPFTGHHEADRCILNPPAQRAIREFSGIDGAFVLRADGIILAAGRYLEEHAGPRPGVPSGLGARHHAAAGITAATRTIAFCVSESTGDTRIFGDGRLLMTIERTD
jgi:diadenylate cyclase